MVSSFIFIVYNCVIFFFVPRIYFSLCSETHFKAEYAIQKPVPCTPHLHEHTKNCNVSLFHSEHNMFNIPAISCQQITTITTATFYFFGAQTHSSATDYSQAPSLLERSLWNRTLIATNVSKLMKKSNSFLHKKTNPASNIAGLPHDITPPPTPFCHFLLCCMNLLAMEATPTYLRWKQTACNNRIQMVCRISCKIISIYFVVFVR